MILDKIVASKRRELAKARSLTPLSDLRARVADVSPAKDFAGALCGDSGHSVRLIAEFKRASPSKGVIRPDLPPDAVARFYEEAGASAMSVLTDGPFFQGHLDDLSLVRKTISLPLLRKDFTLGAYQIVEARCAGADAILLIAAILTTDELRDLREEAEALGMAALVEVHNDEELDSALASDPKIIGVNNRNLKTFTVDLETTFRLCAAMPDSVIRVSESGIRVREDVERMQARRIDAVLVGETCMRRANPADAVRELLGTD